MSPNILDVATIEAAVKDPAEEQPTIFGADNNSQTQSKPSRQLQSSFEISKHDSLGRSSRVSSHDQVSPTALGLGSPDEAGFERNSGLAASRWKSEYTVPRHRRFAAPARNVSSPRSPVFHVPRNLTEEQKQISEDVSAAMRLFDQDLVSWRQEQHAAEEARIKSTKLTSYFTKRPTSNPATIYAFNLSTGDSRQVNAAEYAREQSKRIAMHEDEIAELKAQLSMLMANVETDRATIQELSVQVHAEMEKTRVARAELLDARVEVDFWRAKSIGATESPMRKTGRRDTGYWSAGTNGEEEELLFGVGTGE